MLTLHDLSEQYQQLLVLAETAGDEAELSAFSDTLEGLGDEIAVKIDSCATVVATLCANANALAEEEKRLRARRQSLLNSADRLKAYMQREMEACGLPKLAGARFTSYIQNNPPAVAIDEEYRIPPEFIRIIREPDKAQIAKAFKEGRKVQGCHMERTKSLRIR